MPYKNPDDKRAQRARWLETNKEAAYEATRNWQKSERGKQKREEWRTRRLAEMAADPTHRSHGRPSGYTAGCRCDRCRISWTQYRNNGKAPAQFRPKADEHGTPGQYTNRGCRCEACTAAKTASMRDYRARRKADAS